MVKARIWKSLNHNCRHFSHSSLKILQSDREYLSVSDSTSPKFLFFQAPSSSTPRRSSPSSYSREREGPARWRRGCRARGSPESCSTSSSPGFLSHCNFCLTSPPPTCAQTRQRQSHSGPGKRKIQRLKFLKVAKVAKKNQGNRDLDLLPHAIPVDPLPIHHHLHVKHIKL